MGYGTNLYTNLYYNRETFNSKGQVMDAIEDESASIDTMKNELKLLALMTEPNKVLPEEMRDNPMFSINERVDEILEELESSYIHKWKLEVLYETWGSTHIDDGRSITYPEKWKLWDRSFVDGDFINSVEYAPDEEKGYKEIKEDGDLQ